MKRDYLSDDEKYELVKIVSKYIYYGIELEDKRIPFSLMDYYCLIDIDIFDIYSFLTSKRFNMQKLSNFYKDIFMRFYNLEGCMYYVVNDPEEILSQNICFYVNKEKREITREDVMEVFDILDAHNIPKYNRLVFTALQRKVNGLPVLPLLEREKEKTH